ncbi:MAG: peptidoglycan endopeptidase [Desulfuromonadales bacterium]|nr:peptidoglycan endopeptidase [Desulfuromonadales bacterium]
MIKYVLLILLWACCCLVTVDAATYGAARSAAPILNTAAYSTIFGGSDGKTLKTDRCGQVRELEFLALPGTVFTILDVWNHGSATVLQVVTDDYPGPAGVKLYVDSRFIEPREEKPPQRGRTLPSPPEIIAALKNSVGSPYVWGGNLQAGVPELVGLFYGSGISAAGRNRLTLAGLDCSGLLYQATGGWTPRNTSQLISFGRAVPMAGKPLDEIAGLLKPLDLITWNGHVLVVLDRETIIESRLECGKPGNGGVMVTPLRQRLREILRTRRPVDIWPTAGKERDIFVVRRWITP